MCVIDTWEGSLRSTFFLILAKSFCPPREANPSLRFFFFSRPLFPPGPLRGFSAPARGDRFFEFKSRQTLLSNEWGCTVTTVHDASAFGGGDTSVLVTPRPPHVDAASATVPLRVWQPLMVAVLVEDTTLSRIEGLRVAGACSRLAYQSAKVTAVAVFGGSLLRSVSDVDVSELMSTVARLEADLTRQDAMIREALDAEPPAPRGRGLLAGVLVAQGLVAALMVLVLGVLLFT